MEKFEPDTSHFNPQDNEMPYLNANGNESFFQIPDSNDYNGEFVYEDEKKMTGMSYHNYLRTYDDMI